MPKKVKILIILLLVLLALILYIIFTSKPVENTNYSASQPAKSKEAGLSDENYKIQVKEIYDAYAKLERDESLTVEKITELKNNLLGIKGFQAKFQKLHLDFVLTLDRTANYLISKDKKEKIVCQQLFNQLKVDNSWLDNL